MKKRIVLCADDYGQANTISQGIIALLKDKRLSATSCMVTSPYWLLNAPNLMPYTQQADIGLHFNLTEGMAISPQFHAFYGEKLFRLSDLLRKSLLRRLNFSVILAEFHAQLDTFQQTLGFLPHFVDGHQHVHHFPVIRDVLIHAYKERLQSQNTYIRLVQGKIRLTGSIKDVKKIIIFNTGSNRLKKLLLQNNIPHNPSFAGIYSFKKAIPYRHIFIKCLNELTDKGLMMCHPGYASLSNDTTLDPIATARASEFAYFASDEFLLDCQREEITLSKFNI